MACFEGEGGREAGRTTPRKEGSEKEVATCRGAAACVKSWRVRLCVMGREEEWEGGGV